MSSKFMHLVKKIDQMICNENTGCAYDLAKKLRVSPRCIYNYIQIMKLNGAPIKYSRSRKSFVYLKSGNFFFGFSLVQEDIPSAN